MPAAITRCAAGISGRVRSSRVIVKSAVATAADKGSSFVTDNETGDVMGDTASAVDDETSCTHGDGHCLHWYEAEACCRCDAPAMTNEQLVEYGSDPIIGPRCQNQGMGLPERPCGFCHEGPCPDYGPFGDASGYRRHLAAPTAAERPLPTRKEAR